MADPLTFKIDAGHTKIILNNEEIDLTINNTAMTLSFEISKAQQKYLTQAKFKVGASVACNFFANNEIIWAYDPVNKKYVQKPAGYVLAGTTDVVKKSSSDATPMVVSLNEYGSDQSVCIALSSVEYGTKPSELTADKMAIYKVLITVKDGGISIKDTSRSLGVGRLVKIVGDNTTYTTGGINIPMLARDDFYVNLVVINGSELYKYDIVGSKLIIYKVTATGGAIPPNLTEKAAGSKINFVIYGMAAQ